MHRDIVRKRARTDTERQRWNVWFQGYVPVGASVQRDRGRGEATADQATPNRRARRRYEGPARWWKRYADRRAAWVRAGTRPTRSKDAATSEESGQKSVDRVADRVQSVAEAWSMEVVRVGTGYRVRREGDRRRFDVGYCDRKVHRRKPGREVDRASNQMARTVRSAGPGARVRVMNTVAQRRKLHPASPYTGAGRVRKDRRGLRKRKPTKKAKA
jgi:hypothetical protein